MLLSWREAPYTLDCRNPDEIRNGREAGPGFRKGSIRGYGFPIRISNSEIVIASEAKQSSFLETHIKKVSWIASSLRSSQ